MCEGNAMSLSVVTASTVSALCLKLLAMKRAADPDYELVEPKALYSKLWRSDEADSSSSSSSSASPKKRKLADGSATMKFDAQIANDRDSSSVLRELAALAAEADATAIHCICETSGGTSNDQILECADCALSVCRRCVIAGQFDLDCHTMSARSLDAATPMNRRSDGATSLFGQKLRRIAPPRLRLVDDSLLIAAAAEIDDARAQKALVTSIFHLKKVVRAKGKWVLTFVAEASGKPIADLQISLGRLAGGPTSFHPLGLQATVRCFPAPGARRYLGILPRVARMTLPMIGGESAPLVWQTREEGKAELKIKGSDPSSSYAAEMGITVKATQKWPSTLSLSISRVASDSESDAPLPSVGGVYTRTVCRGSCCQGMLFRRARSSSSGSSASCSPCGGDKFIFLRADEDKTRPDQIVVSTSSFHHDRPDIEVECPGDMIATDLIVQPPKKVKKGKSSSPLKKAKTNTSKITTRIVDTVVWVDAPGVGLNVTATQLEVNGPAGKLGCKEVTVTSVDGLTVERARFLCAPTISKARETDNSIDSAVLACSKAAVIALKAKKSKSPKKAKKKTTASGAAADGSPTKKRKAQIQEDAAADPLAVTGGSLELAINGGGHTVAQTACRFSATLGCEMIKFAAEGGLARVSEWIDIGTTDTHNVFDSSVGWGECTHHVVEKPEETWVKKRNGAYPFLTSFRPSLLCLLYSRSLSRSRSLSLSPFLCPSLLGLALVALTLRPLSCSLLHSPTHASFTYNLSSISTPRAPNEFLPLLPHKQKENSFRSSTLMLRSNSPTLCARAPSRGRPRCAKSAPTPPVSMSLRALQSLRTALRLLSLTVAKTFRSHGEFVNSTEARPTRSLSQRISQFPTLIISIPWTPRHSSSNRGCRSTRASSVHWDVWFRLRRERSISWSGKRRSIRWCLALVSRWKRRRKRLVRCVGVCWRT